MQVFVETYTHSGRGHCAPVYRIRSLHLSVAFFRTFHAHHHPWHHLPSSRLLVPPSRMPPTRTISTLTRQLLCDLPRTRRHPIAFAFRKYVDKPHRDPEDGVPVHEFEFAPAPSVRACARRTAATGDDHRAMCRAGYGPHQNRGREFACALPELDNIQAK